MTTLEHSATTYRLADIACKTAHSQVCEAARCAAAACICPGPRTMAIHAGSERSSEAYRAANERFSATASAVNHARDMLVAVALQSSGNTTPLERRATTYRQAKQQYDKAQSSFGVASSQSFRKQISQEKWDRAHIVCQATATTMLDAERDLLLTAQSAD